MVNLIFQTYQTRFPVLARAARDILAIPAVNVTVERLFSSCKHTLRDTRSSLTAETSRKTVLVKEWLKDGLGENVNYLDVVSIWGSG